MLPSVGEVFTGKVVQVVPFGSFVEHPNGTHGLIQGYSAEVGSPVSVRVLVVDTERRRFSLGLA